MFTARLPGACAALSKLRKVTAAVLSSLPGPKRMTWLAPLVDLLTRYGVALARFLRTSTTFQVPCALASTNSPLLLIDSASAITTPRRRYGAPPRVDVQVMLKLEVPLARAIPAISWLAVPVPPMLYRSSRLSPPKLPGR
ncbi:hypothetical protein G6F59_017217 [Rhizopus arrhizus]|nr:hypothetical protein G6F59_017217 [Rhizopus arrhizus]